MGYASKLGKARVSSRHPVAAAVCDRCGGVYSHDRLRWNYDWAGNKLINTRLLVCEKCNDVPNTQLRAIIIPADPMPVSNPRVQDYLAAESDYRVTSGQDTKDFFTGIPIPGAVVRVTQSGGNRVVQEVGEPPGGLSYEPGTDANAVMPLSGTTKYGVTLSIISMVSDNVNGSTINVTCSSAHGLITNGQISVRGSSNVVSDGMFSVTVTSPLAFNYQLPYAIALNTPVLQGNTLVQTALVGLPYDMTTIPQTGALK